ncbi:MAG TPA: hypothetical protein VKA60_19640 [Blastocatellia bacterium]|nr:hypothetical protein [Blastocatellia bacterium]
MKHSLLTLLPLIEPALSRDLVPSEALESIKRTLARLPLLSGGLLECSLGGHQRSVDLAVRATAADGGFRWLAEASGLEQAFGDGEGWQRVREFARLRNQAPHPLHKAVKEAWLEFDLDAGEAIELPNLFFGLDDHVGRPPLLGPEVASRLSESVAVIRDGLETLGIRINPARKELLEQILTNRPATSRLSYVGVMLARQTPGYRLTIDRVPLSELTGYLRQLGWPHAREPVAGVISFLLDQVRHVVLHLDVAEQALSRIGMEVSFEQTVDLVAAWKRFLQALTAIGLCVPAKAEAAHNWPAYFHPQNLSERWPESLPRTSSYFARSINHVKLSYDPGTAPIESGAFTPISIQSAVGALSAKIYLAFNYGSTIPRSILSRG